MGLLPLCEAPLLPSLKCCTGLQGFQALIVPAGLSAYPGSELPQCYQVHSDKMLKPWHKSAISAWSTAGFFPLYRIGRKKKEREREIFFAL